MGSEENRLPLQQATPPPRRKRWVGCWGGLSCFGKRNGGKRIVPASRIPAANSANLPNGPQANTLVNQGTALAPSLLAPPSSPASFSNSALPSTAQSPSCFLSANSPGGPPSTMFATGPYAHETQLVSPPVFSTFTTEPSTASLTPPPELAHLTTPSSPDVPFAQFLSSSADLKDTGKTNFISSNDLQGTYSLYPGSPASSLRSPVSMTSGTNSGQLFGLETVGTTKTSQDSNFFCPATFAQFYLDPSSFPQSGGRLSVSKESDAYSNAGSTHQNKQNKTSKQDVEELEAYRASFGFSADEIVTTPQYVEISDVLDDSFTMTPFSSNKPQSEGSTSHAMNNGSKTFETIGYASPRCQKSGFNLVEGLHGEAPNIRNSTKESSAQKNQFVSSEDEDIFSKMGSSRVSRRYHIGLSKSDAEVEYRRGRSLREGKRDGLWHE